VQYLIKSAKLNINKIDTSSDTNDLLNVFEIRVVMISNAYVVIPLQLDLIIRDWRSGINSIPGEVRQKW